MNSHRATAFAAEPRVRDAVVALADRFGGAVRGRRARVWRRERRRGRRQETAKTPGKTASSARHDFMGRTTTFAYDSNDQLHSRTYPDNSVVSFIDSGNSRTVATTVGRLSPSRAKSALSSQRSNKNDLSRPFLGISHSLHASRQGGGPSA
jgi:YD repeat-containing protein